MCVYNKSNIYHKINKYIINKISRRAQFLSFLLTVVIAFNY